MVRSHSAPSSRNVRPCSVEHVERVRDRARLAVVQRALAEPVVEDDAEAREAVLGLGDHERDPELRDLVDRQVAGALDLRGELADVGALVAVRGRLLAAGARADRLAEAPGLGAVVVDVELAVDAMSHEREEPRERVAVGGVARAADVHRAGRVRADELDVHRERGIGAAAAPARRPRPGRRRAPRRTRRRRA